MGAERWKPIPGWEDYYEASDHGRVRSVERTITMKNGRTRRLPAKVLKDGESSCGGYRVVALSRDSKPISFRVHRLVLAAFTGPAPEGMDSACHNDGDPTNNHLDNLRWDSQAANMAERRRHGTDHNVNKTHCPQGHPYDDENTYVLPSRPTARYCRTCRNTTTYKKAG